MASQTIDLPTHSIETDDVPTLLSKLERTQAAYVSAIMERNFLRRAMADLNFHHNAIVGIVYTDEQNRVVYANPHFLQMMKLSDPAEILGQPLPNYMWESPKDQKQLFNDVHTGGFVRERELSLYNYKGEPVFVACSSVASKDDEGNFIGTEIMLCNVTSKRKMQTQLAERTRVLERVTEFSRHSLNMMVEMTNRGATRREMLTVLKQLQDQLEQAAR